MRLRDAFAGNGYEQGYSTGFTEGDNGGQWRNVGMHSLAYQAGYGDGYSDGATARNRRLRLDSPPASGTIEPSHSP